MVPFRVFDRDNKQMWQIINYHPDPSSGGSYLAALEDDTGADGDLRLIRAEDLVKFKFVDFLEEVETFAD